MKISRRLSLLLLLSAQAAAAAEISSADNEQNQVDTSQWLCKFCEFEKGVRGTVDVGAGYVSQDSFKFGEYTGLNEKGGFFIGNVDTRYRAENADYWNIRASNLGLDSRTISADGGRQGRYSVFLEYDEIPHFISDSTATPYLGAGGSSLTLPAGWVFAGTTGGMSALAGSLQPVDLETQRKQLGVGASFIPVPTWELAVKFRHETKEGVRRIAGTFFFNSAQLVQPVDYDTDQVDASASYTGKKLQARFSYYLSTFDNGSDFLKWQDPYTPSPFTPPFTTGATAGQLALPPDNRFHQLLAAAGYQFSDRTRATADLALGRMTQDDNFLAATLNSPSPALPGSSLDGRVDTVNGALKAVSLLTDRLRLNAAYIYDDRDNKTPQSSYNWVTTDSAVNAPRTNLPYSFTQSTAKLSADYRSAKRMNTSVGVDHSTLERTFQSVDKNRENTIWGKFTTRVQDQLDLSLRVSRGTRDKSGYQVVPGIDPPENPLLSKYNLADRTRNNAVFRMDIAAAQNLSIGFGLDLSKDEYSRSVIGLTESSDRVFSTDVTAVVTTKTSVNFFLNHEEINSVQAGAQTFSLPDWSGENNDTVDAVGIGAKHAVIRDKLDIGADYTVSRSRGEVSVATGAPAPAFPDLLTRLGSVRLSATYRLTDSVSLLGVYWYETYRTDNWTLDGVSYATIPNVLTLGEQSPSYDVSVVSLSARYRF